jgi:hypothetical protein
MERRCRLGDVLADDGGVADLAVAETQLVVCEADGARIVGALGLRERLRQKRDATRRLSACGRQAAVHPPKLREASRLEPFARFGRTAKRLGGLAQIILEEPRLGERAADLDLFVARETGTFEQANQKRGRLLTAASFERFQRLSQTVRG